MPSPPSTSPPLPPFHAPDAELPPRRRFAWSLWPRQQHRPELSSWARWMPFELLLALRFLREGRMQSTLILAGVTGGVAVIIFLTQLINQLQSTIIDRVMGSQAHVVIRPTEELTRRVFKPEASQSVAAVVQPREQRLRSVDQWERVAALAAITPGVLAVSPVASGPAFAARGNYNKSVVLQGVNPDAYRRVVNMDNYMTRGRFDVTGSHALIGIDLAQDLGLTLGDKLRITSASGRSETLQVTGLFDMGNRDLNRRWVFVPLKLAQSLLDLPGGVSNIDLTVTELFSADRVADTLRLQTGLTVDSWMQTNSGLLNALSNQTVSNNLIRSFVILIVALGITSVLVVSVVQKQREIGILRAMGAGRRQIMAVFLLQGGLVGLVGSLLGAALAYALLVVFSHIFKSPDGSPMFAPELDPQLVLLASLVACGVGLAAAFVPARGAARMDPVQAIRA